MESVQKYCQSKVYKSEPKLRNSKLCKYCLLYSSGEILKSVAQSLFTINKHGIANVADICMQAYINYIIKFKTCSKLFKMYPKLFWKSPHKIINFFSVLNIVG